MSRQQKTPRQRAEEALAVAQRRVERLTTQRDKAQSALSAVATELDEAKARLDYARKDPALPRTTDPLDPTISPGGTTV